MTFSDSAVTDVVVDTSGETASIGAAAADELRDQLLAAGSAEIDGVSGSTITSEAVMKAAKSCYAQAKGEAVVSSVQLPTGDENDWPIVSLYDIMLLIASIILESSPPEATFDNDLGG